MAVILVIIFYLMIRILACPVVPMGRRYGFYPGFGGGLGGGGFSGGGGSFGGGGASGGW
jgi:uncharacterized protein